MEDETHTTVAKSIHEVLATSTSCVFRSMGSDEFHKATSTQPFSAVLRLLAALDIENEDGVGNTDFYESATR
jgi:hypothetical protein